MLQNLGLEFLNGTSGTAAVHGDRSVVDLYVERYMILSFHFLQLHELIGRQTERKQKKGQLLWSFQLIMMRLSSQVICRHGRPKARSESSNLYVIFSIIADISQTFQIPLLVILLLSQIIEVPCGCYHAKKRPCYTLILILVVI